jgi:hypothetical protein
MSRKGEKFAYSTYVCPIASPRLLPASSSSGSMVHIGHVVPGLEHLPNPLGISSDPPEVVGVYDDHLPAVRFGWVLASAPLVAGGDSVGGAADEVFVAVAGEGGRHADRVAGRSSDTESGRYRGVSHVIHS